MKPLLQHPTAGAPSFSLKRTQFPPPFPANQAEADPEGTVRPQRVWACWPTDLPSDREFQARIRAFGGTNPIPNSSALAPVEQDAQPEDNAPDAFRRRPSRDESRPRRLFPQGNQGDERDQICGALHRRMK
jgi:hypothetical protein